MELTTKKKGPRPMKEEEKRVSMPTYATAKEWQLIKKQAVKANKSISRFIIEKALSN